MFAVALVPNLAAHAITGYLRVNQLGYESGLSARAYLMTSSPISGATFTVKNSVGTVVASGWVGAKLGSWGTYSVYPIDFIVTAVSKCTISVNGVVSAASSSFRVDTPANLYATALANNLYFHENQRDGMNFVPTPLRTAAGHLNDANATVYSTPVFDNNDLVIGSLNPTGI
ncbi:MAG: hypothetical protein M3O09_16070, partial [Acidobacteriota bacterium]|nr:hypothetical protein [Acidobacteriota bacterium]